MALHIELWAEDEVPAAYRALLPGWQAACFPDDPSDGIVWTEADWQQWVCDDDGPVSVLKIIARTVYVGDQAVRVGGIASVMTPPEQRGHGYASIGMRAAVDFIQTVLEAPFGLLGCHDHNVPFYERLGWKVVNAEFTFSQPDGRTKQRFPWQDNVMILPLGDETWPDGPEIDFNGLPW